MGGAMGVPPVTGGKKKPAEITEGTSTTETASAVRSVPSTILNLHKRTFVPNWRWGSPQTSKKASVSRCFKGLGAVGWPGNRRYGSPGLSDWQ